MRGVVKRGEAGDDLPVEMTANSRKDLLFSLLLAVGVHLVLFFGFIVLLIFGLLSGEIVADEREDEWKEEVQMELVFLPNPTSAVPAVPAEQVPEPVMPDRVGFVQTREDQAVEKAPEEAMAIGERNTVATSDAGAVAGAEAGPALAGSEERKQDVKTFDSDFAPGENEGPGQGVAEAGKVGQGEAAVTEKMAAEVLQKEEMEEEKEAVAEEKMVEPLDDELAAIDQALANLEEGIQQEAEKKAPVQEPVKDPAEKNQEAANRDGGFAPRARKTRVTGVLSASGSGSLNVENTAVGRYQGAILRQLERAWQMENIRNRSLLVPGSIALYFVVDDKGRISQQRRLAINGASGTQWGMILRALDTVEAPKMSPEVVKELEGDTLELAVTFNY